MPFKIITTVFSFQASCNASLKENFPKIFFSTKGSSNIFFLTKKEFFLTLGNNFPSKIKSAAAAAAAPANPAIEPEQLGRNETRSFTRQADDQQDQHVVTHSRRARLDWRQHAPAAQPLRLPARPSLLFDLGSHYLCLPYSYFTTRWWHFLSGPKMLVFYGSK